MNKTFVIGIDPGKNGGIVSLTNGKITTIDAMPSSIEALWSHFEFLGFPNMILRKESTYVYIESVHSMPTDGVRSAFTFGHHNGVLDSILVRSNCRVNRILPSKWMNYFNLKRDKEKETKYDYKKRLAEQARIRTPERWKKTLTLKTADAYLIALYGYNQIKQEEESK